jgi:hypothetical protein
MRNRGILTLLLCTLSFAKSPAPGNLSVTTTISYTDASGAAAEIQSDGLGSYFDNVNAVTSFLTTNGYNGIIWGDWQFGTLNSTVRKVNVTFDSPIPVAGGGTATPNPPFTSKNVIAHFEDKCTAFSYSMLRMAVGQKFLCPAVVHFFDSNGNEFRIYMAPNSTQPPTPETTYVQVSCNGIASDGCNDWFVDPIPQLDVNGNPIPGQATGRLVGPPYTGRGKTSSDGNQGDFYFRFHVHVTRP